jgi:hypothetical protein
MMWSSGDQPADHANCEMEDAPPRCVPHLTRLFHTPISHPLRPVSYPEHTVANAATAS